MFLRQDEIFKPKPSIDPLGTCVEGYDCGTQVTHTVNEALRSRGIEESKFLPKENLGVGIPGYISSKFETPLLRKEDITLDQLRAMGPGTTIAMTRRPGDKNYEYGKTHAEVTAVNPETGELMVASKSAGKGIRWKKLDEDYIKTLPKATTASNPFSDTLAKVGEWLGPKSAEAAEGPPATVSTVPTAPTSTAPTPMPLRADVLNLDTMSTPTIDIQPPEAPVELPGASKSPLEDLNMPMADWSEQFDPSQEIGGVPLYEWALYLGLLVTMPYVGAGVAARMGLARFVGPHIARALGMAIAGTGIDLGESALEALGIYHKTKHEPGPRLGDFASGKYPLVSTEGLEAALSPAHTIFGQTDNPFLGALQEGMNWALLEPLFMAAGKARNVLSPTRRAEKLIRDTAAGVYEKRLHGGAEIAKQIRKGKVHVPEHVMNRMFEKHKLQQLPQSLWEKHIGEPTWNFLSSKVGNVKVPFSKKTVSEMFTPAIQRLRASSIPTELRAARMIDDAKLSRALTEEGLQYLQGAEAKMVPWERWELHRAIARRSRESITSPLVKQTMEGYDKIMKRAGSRTMDDLYSQHFVANYDKVVGKPLRELEEQMEGILKAQGKKLVMPTHIGRVLRRYSPEPGASPREIRHRLKEMINDPLVPQPLRDYAIQLHDLPASTPNLVRKSSMSSMVSTITSRLKADPEIVSAAAKPGFVKSAHTEFKDLFVPKDVELEMDAIKSIHKYSQGMYQKWFLSPWKTNKVVMRPSAHFRNLYSNLMLNDWGGLPFYRMDTYTKALGHMRSKHPAWKEFRDMSAFAGRFSLDEAARTAHGIKHGDNMFHTLLNAYDTVAQPFRHAYGVEEAWFKYAKYLHNLDKGMDKQGALLDAVKWTFNYGEITPAVAAIRSHMFGMPFFTWTSKAIPLFFEAQIKNPLRVGKWWAFFYGLHQMGLSESGMSSGEWSDVKSKLPDYIKNGLWMMMPWRDEQQRLKMLNLTWMIPGLGDLAELSQRGVQNPWSVVLQNPLMNLGGALSSGYTELGVPIWYDWEPHTTQFAKAASHIWKWWAPAIFPYGTDLQTLVDAVQGRPEALSPMEAVASQFGLRMRTIDPALVRRRHKSLQKIHLGQANVMMRRELRNAVSDQEREEIINRYRPIRQDILAPSEE